jgi:hypothetical protein
MLGMIDVLYAKNTTWASDSMTQATQKLLDEFEALPDREPQSAEWNRTISFGAPASYYGGSADSRRR